MARAKRPHQSETTLQAMREDARLQPDPELQMSGGHRAGPWQIAFTFLAGFVLVFGVLYGINHQRTEADRNAEGGTLTAQAPASAENENVAGGEAKDQQAQREGKGGEPAGTPETTGAGQKTEQAPDAQPAPAKPTTSGSQR